MQFKRPAAAREPFRAHRGASAALLVHRQLQRRKQGLNLLLGHALRIARAAAGRGFVNVESRQPAREELAVDRTLAESFRAAESKLQAELIQSFGHVASV